MTGERKFPRLPTAKDRLRGNREIRRHLNLVRKHILAIKAYHVESWKRMNGHKEPCRVCVEIDFEITGVRRAIRHFGGYPR